MQYLEDAVKTHKEPIHLDQLTSMRFFAALSVTLHHYGRGGLLEHSLPRAFYAGPAMVTFFFVLSGMVLWIAYDQRNETTTKFLVARARRILPVYILALTIAFLMSDMMHNKRTLLVQLLLLQAWIPQYSLALNGPGWSLSVEAFLYSIFMPFRSAFANRSFSLHVAVACILYLSSTVFVSIAVLAASPGSFLLLASTFFPPSHLASFIIGTVTGRLFLKWRSNTPATADWVINPWIWLSIVFLCLHFEAEISIFMQPLHVSYRTGFLSPAFAGLLLSFSLSRGKVIRLFQSAPLVVLGHASYSLYILQVPLIALVASYLSKPLAESSEWAIVRLLFLVSISVLSYTLIEKPVIAALCRRKRI